MVWIRFCVEGVILGISQIWVAALNSSPRAWAALRHMASSQLREMLGMLGGRRRLLCMFGSVCFKASENTLGSELGLLRPDQKCRAKRRFPRKVFEQQMSHSYPETYCLFWLCTGEVLYRIAFDCYCSFVITLRMVLILRFTKYGNESTGGKAEAALV